MPELNKANRQTCDIDIRILKTMAPFLFFDTANVTTAGLSGDSVYAMAKGSRRIAFANPLEGTMSIEAQVYPFKFFALLSDGEIETTAAYAASQTIEATEAGKLAIEVKNGTITAGTVFAYPLFTLRRIDMVKECLVVLNNDLVTVARFDDKDIQFPSVRKDMKKVLVLVIQMKQRRSYLLCSKEERYQVIGVRRSLLLRLDYGGYYGKDFCGQYQTGSH